MSKAKSVKTGCGINRCKENKQDTAYAMEVVPTNNMKTTYNMKTIAVNNLGFHISEGKHEELAIRHKLAQYEAKRVMKCAEEQKQVMLARRERWKHAKEETKSMEMLSLWQPKPATTVSLVDGCALIMYVVRSQCFLGSRLM